MKYLEASAFLFYFFSLYESEGVNLRPGLSRECFYILFRMQFPRVNADGAAAFSGILRIPPTRPGRCRGRQLNQACVSLSGSTVSTCCAVCRCGDSMCRCSDRGLCPAHISNPGPPSAQLQHFLSGLVFCTRLFIEVTRKHECCKILERFGKLPLSDKVYASLSPKATADTWQTSDLK